MIVTETLTYNEVKEICRDILLAGETPYIKGGPGIGKSAVAKDVAEELGLPLYFLNAVLLQPLDYAMPIPNHQTKKIEIYPTGVVPTEGPALVLIDDLPLASEEQQKPLFQMTLEKRIGNIVLKNVDFIGTGNRETDKAGVNPILTPLKDRMITIHMSPDIEEWLTWARRNEILPEIIGFLQYRPDLLYQDPPSEDDIDAWPTPRSWHKASNILKQGEKTDRKIRFKLYGSVGKQAADAFMAWFKYLQEINPRDIVEKGQIPGRNDRGFIFAVLQSVAGLLKTKNKSYINTHSQNIRSFFSWLPGEFKAAWLKELVVYKKDSKVPNISILEAVREAVPEVTNYVWDILGNNN